MRRWLTTNPNPDPDPNPNPSPNPNPNQVAIATGQLLSGWHGTGAGELAGWSGNWIHHPPAIAHFVGGLPAGGKVRGP